MLGAKAPMSRSVRLWVALLDSGLRALDFTAIFPLGGAIQARKLALAARAESPTPEGQGSATHPINTVNNGLQLTGTGLQIARSLRDRAANPRRQLNPDVGWPLQSDLVASQQQQHLAIDGVSALLTRPSGAFRKAPTLCRSIGHIKVPIRVAAIHAVMLGPKGPTPR